MAQNYGLGRGLSSLIPSKKASAASADKKITEPQSDFNYFGAASVGSGANVKKNDEKNVKKPTEEGILQIDVNNLSPNPHQPRTAFNEADMSELAASIKEHGIIQPLIVTEKDGKYELIAGERRLEAAKMSGLSTVPAIVRDADEKEKLELAIIENVQRHDLDPIEEAKSYKKLNDEFNMSQEEVAVKLGRSRSVVANKIRLLNLPQEIQKALVSGKITEGHCKLLLAIPNPEKQKSFFDLIIRNSLTVRQTEDKTREVSVRPHKRNVAVDPERKRMEDELSEVLKTKVKLIKSGDGGRIMVEYYSSEELANIVSLIIKK
jgi:ParB family transcriptional regulator, chromosome partitioning protein